MAIKSAPYYWVECDECGVREDAEFSAWSDVRSAIDVVESWDYGWLITDDGHWCPDCRGKHEEGDEDRLVKDEYGNNYTFNLEYPRCFVYRVAFRPICWKGGGITIDLTDGTQAALARLVECGFLPDKDTSKYEVITGSHALDPITITKEGVLHMRLVPVPQSVPDGVRR